MNLYDKLPYRPLDYIIKEYNKKSYESLHIHFRKQKIIIDANGIEYIPIDYLSTILKKIDYQSLQVTFHDDHNYSNKMYKTLFNFISTFEGPVLFNCDYYEIIKKCINTLFKLSSLTLCITQCNLNEITEIINLAIVKILEQKLEHFILITTKFVSDIKHYLNYYEEINNLKINIVKNESDIISLAAFSIKYIE